MSGVETRLGRLKNPEYTGANRCTPCTIVNTIIGLALAAVLGAAAGAVGPTWLGAAAGAATLLVSAASIYFRGYLVPGTPTLTKRYFPDWFLAYFDKGPAASADDPTGGSGPSWGHTYNKVPNKPEQDDGGEDETGAAVEKTLIQAGALTECENVEDLCLADDFAEKLYDRTEQLSDENATRDQLLDLLDLEEGDVTTEEYETGFRVLTNGHFVGRWESHAAFVADIAAGELLRERIDDWEDLNVMRQGDILSGLRLFLDTCPSCGGVVSFSNESVESCCREYQVAAVTCEDCDATLFESDARAP